MKFTLEHESGNTWLPRKKRINGVDHYVLTTANTQKLRDEDGQLFRSNLNRFHVFISDEQSVLNGLQAGLSIRMEGQAANGKMQQNLFSSSRILVDGIPVMNMIPAKRD